jgi:hypothetical protein
MSDYRGLTPAEKAARGRAAHVRRTAQQPPKMVARETLDRFPGTASQGSLIAPTWMDRLKALLGEAPSAPSAPRPETGMVRQQQPSPSDAEFLRMWEERNRMLQQQKREEGRRRFEEPIPGRPRGMLPSGASAPIQSRFPEALPRPQKRFEGGDLGRPITPQETSMPGEGVYDWEEKVRQAEEALRAAQGAVGG